MESLSMEENGLNLEEREREGKEPTKIESNCLITSGLITNTDRHGVLML